MIGKVISPSGTVATLRDDGTWSASVPDGVPAEVARLTVESLAAFYPPQGPQDGDGAWPVRDLAKRWGGTAVIEEKQPPPEGTIH